MSQQENAAGTDQMIISEGRLSQAKANAIRDQWRRKHLGLLPVWRAWWMDFKLWINRGRGMA